MQTNIYRTIAISIASIGLAISSLNAEVVGFGNFEETGVKLEPIYFDTDKDEIKTSEQLKIDSNAKVIVKDNLKVIVIGNADLRGDRAYNISLGSKRALAVALELMKLGVQQKQITLISYGEERPVAKELQSNRRVDTVSIRLVKEVVKERVNRKNRIIVHGGGGPNGLNDVILKQDHAKFEQYYGPVFGLGYSRLITDRLSIGVTGFSNKSGFLNLGLDF